MKKNKLIICFASLTAPVVLSTALVGCSAKEETTQYTISFSASSGISLSSSTPIKVNKGAVWSDLVKSKKVPSVTASENYLLLGWCLVNEEGQYTYIEDNYIVESNINVKYIGYDEVEHPKISVNVDYLPGAPETEKIAVDFAGGLTFQSFRNYYNIPKTPKMEGYEFDGYFSGQTVVSDDFTFPKYTTPLTLKWIANKHKISLATDGNGTVKAAKTEFDYGKTWAEIKTDLSIETKANDGYEFYKWVDEEGDDLVDTRVLTKNFTAKALFKSIERVNVTFTCSDGCTLMDGETPYTTVKKKVKLGSTWQDLINVGDVIPTPVYDQTQYDELGWCAITQSGEYTPITPEFIFDGSTNIKFVLYSKSETWIDVEFIYGPDKVKHKQTLKFVRGWNFGEFRQYYNIPKEPEYKGYTFNGFYIGDVEKIDDSYIFPDQTGIQIVASFTALSFAVNLSTNGHGLITSSTSLTKQYGTKWKDIVPEINTSPNAGYKLEKWVNLVDGKIIEDDYEITGSLNARAIFTPWETKIEIVDTANHYTRSLYCETDSHGNSVNVNYTDTVKGATGGSEDKRAYNDPTANANKLFFSNYERNCNFRFITIPIQISTPIFARTSKKYNIRLNVEHVRWLHGFIGDTQVQNTFEVFHLSNIEDHPVFYANCKGPDDTRASDERSIFRESQNYSEVTWGPLSRTDKFSIDLGDFEKTNTTDETIIDNHYFEISFLVEGVNSSRNGRQSHELTCEFVSTDVE